MNENTSPIKKTNADRIKKAVGFVLAAAVIFVSVYLFSGDRGAWQGVPVVLFAPAFASILFPDRKAIYALFVIFAFVLSALDKSDVSYSLLYTAVTVCIAIVSVFVKRLVETAIRTRGLKGLLMLVASVVITVISLYAYFIYNGTYMGNLRAAEKNKAAFSEKYSDCEIEFTPGNTFYSHRAGGYLTDMDFWHGESITAEYGADTKSGTIDGYRNYCSALMMNERANELARLLSFYYGRDIDFAVRYGEMSGDDILLPYGNSDAYAEKMSFEIAFYGVLDSKEVFSSECREYFKHIEEDGFVYENVTFYGGKGQDFKYEMTLPHGFADGISADTVENFKKSDFRSYKNEDDIKDYWK